MASIENCILHLGHVNSENKKLIKLFGLIISSLQCQFFSAFFDGGLHIVEGSIGRMKLYLSILLSISPVLPAPWKAAFLMDYIEKFEGHSITIVTSSSGSSLSRKHLSQVTNTSIK